VHYAALLAKERESVVLPYFPNKAIGTPLADGSEKSDVTLSARE